MEWNVSPSTHATDLSVRGSNPGGEFEPGPGRSVSRYEYLPQHCGGTHAGWNKLAVNGVVIVGEHGDYPKTPKGQVEYPRYRFFQETVQVFQASGRSVPVFNDKHISWNWEWAKQMYRTSQSMGFPLLAGSSLPVTWRIPSLEMPRNAGVKEAVTDCYGAWTIMTFMV